MLQRAEKINSFRKSKYRSQPQCPSSYFTTRFIFVWNCLWCKSTSFIYWTVNGHPKFMNVHFTHKKDAIWDHITEIKFFLLDYLSLPPPASTLEIWKMLNVYGSKRFKLTKCLTTHCEPINVKSDKTLYKHVLLLCIAI